MSYTSSLRSSSILFDARILFYRADVPCIFRSIKKSRENSLLIITEILSAERAASRSSDDKSLKTYAGSIISFVLMIGKANGSVVEIPFARFDPAYATFDSVEARFDRYLAFHERIAKCCSPRLIIRLLIFTRHQLIRHLYGSDKKCG